MNFVQAWLSARIHRESSFNHRREHVMHVETCISASKDRQKQFLPLWRFCEARASLVKCQETSRKQFSALWGFCEAPAGLFKCAKGLRL